MHFPDNVKYLWHSYYMNSYVTLPFNVGHPFCLMDVSQWLYNLQPKRHKLCIFQNGRYLRN